MKDISGRHSLEFIHCDYEELETNKGNHEEASKKDNIFGIFFCYISFHWYRWRHDLQLDANDW